MNANELADELEVMLKAVGLTDNRVPTMLRKQQEEIEYWKEMFEKSMKAQEIKAQEK
jgi:NifB/MoaA-like Fe-S oxidoreductase